MPRCTRTTCSFAISVARRYWGTFEVAPGQVTHHVKGTLDPAIVGTDRVRKFELRGDELILMVAPFACSWALDSQCTPGDLVGLRLTWKR